MWWFLVLLGILIAFAGLSVIALGISIFVSTFGNTLITTGAVAASGGFVITAMGLVLRQMERLSQRIEIAIERGRAEEGTPAAIQEEVEAAPPLGQRRPGALPFPPREEAIPQPVSGPREEALTEALARESTGEGETAGERERPSRGVGSRRLFGGERSKPELRTPSQPDENVVSSEPPTEEPAAPRQPLPQRGAQPAAPNDPMLQARRERLARREEVPAEPEPAPKRTPAPPQPQTGYEPPPRAPRMAEPQRMAQPQPPTPPNSEATPEPEAPAAPEEPRVLKSGIVGGMAYTLYSDGSIQAELPDGVVRFASLQELRDHVARAQQMR